MVGRPLTHPTRQSQAEEAQNERLRLTNKSQSVFGLKVVSGTDIHLHSGTWARWISLILN